MSKKTEALREKYKEAHVYYQYVGNYTVAEAEFNGNRGIGISKRNPSTDKYDSHRGATIAYWRALMNLDERVKEASVVLAAIRAMNEQHLNIV